MGSRMLVAPSFWLMCLYMCCIINVGHDCRLVTAPRLVLMRLEKLLLRPETLHPYSKETGHIRLESFPFFSRIDLFKEVCFCLTFFWKMADILSKGILWACNDRDCERIRRASAAIVASNSRTIEDKERAGICENKCWKYLQKLGKPDASYKQKGIYLIECLLEQISLDLNPFFHFYFNYSWIWSKIYCTTSRKWVYFRNRVYLCVYWVYLSWMVLLGDFIELFSSVNHRLLSDHAVQFQIPPTVVCHL